MSSKHSYHRGLSKVNEGSDLQNANKFKMTKNWDAAGHAFTEIAALDYRSGNRRDAATNYVEAGNCYKKTDPNEAVNSLLKATEIHTDMGKFNKVAKHHQSIADIYANEMDDIEMAFQHYEQASDYFRGEGHNSSANKCLLKVAMFAAEMKKYDKAIQIYEQVSESSLQSSLLKYSATGYMFRAALCRLCVDLVDAEIALTKYEEMNPAFQESRERNLIKVLITHLEEQNVEAFTDTVRKYESISPFDQWCTTMLLRIKKTINAVDLC